MSHSLIKVIIMVGNDKLVSKTNFIYLNKIDFGDFFFVKKISSKMSSTYKNIYESKKKKKNL